MSDHCYGRSIATPNPQPFRPIQGRRIFEEILDQLEQAILDGHISAGDRLPPERELAERFGVSYMTARRAVSDLVDANLLERRREGNLRPLLGAPGVAGCREG